MTESLGVLATRYTCSHESHGDELPTFPVWSSLQTHIRHDHPPSCPHEECSGRVFKSTRSLKDHLRVHGERVTDLEDQKRLGELVGEAGDDLHVSKLSKKRGRGEEQNGGKSSKLARVFDGQAGKVHACGVVGCEKTFKTVSNGYLVFPAENRDSSASLSTRIIDRVISASRSTHALMTIATNRMPTNALWIDTLHRTTSLPL